MFKRNFLKFGFAASLLAGAFPGAAMAEGKTWKVSVAQLPFVAESKDKGAVIDVLKAMERASGDKFEIQVVPFARSMSNVIDHNVDFHYPIVQVPGSTTGRDKYDYATEPLYYANFVLYTTKGSSVTPANVKTANVETDPTHLEHFDFAIKPSSNLESSMKKVDAGRIDGVIFPDVVIDPIVKQGKLTNVKRTLYKKMAVVFVLPKGERGGATDKFLSQTIAKMRATGEWAKVIAPLDTPYNDWQP